MSKQPKHQSRKAPKIFISYRRADGRGQATHLHADLKRHFGDPQIFMDTAGITGGEDFVRVIEARLASCDVLIAVIGPHWLELLGETPPSPGAKPDWVRLEIAGALEKRLLVIPVLVDDASMPEMQELVPFGLEHLAPLHAVKLRDEQWDIDLAQLLRILEPRIPRRKGLGLTIVVALAAIAVFCLLGYFARVRRATTFDVNTTVNLPAASQGDVVIVDSPVLRPDPSPDPSASVDPDLIPTTAPLLSVQAPEAADILVKFDRAQFSTDTINEYDLDPPSTVLGPIIFSAAGRKPNAVSNRPCSISIEIEAEKGKAPEALHFFLEPDSAEGGKEYRALAMKGVGAELVIKLSVNSSTTDAEKVAESEEDGPGCRKNLKTPSGRIEVLIAPRTVETIVAANSVVHFRFMPRDSQQPLWQGENGFLSPFAFASSRGEDESPLPGLQASTVNIKRLNVVDILRIQRVDANNPLRVDALAVGPNQLRISVSGEGLVTQNDKDTFGYEARFGRDPVKLSALMLAAVLLSVWLGLRVRRLFLSSS